MAEMIPEILPKRASMGERKIFNILKNLPSGYIVYYEPIIKERYPDFLVIAPDLGILVIEVKGWSADMVLGGDDNDIVIRDNGLEKKVQHPVRQAKDYQWKLVDLCRTSPEFKHLLHRSGEMKNRFTFPFGHFAILSNITESQLIHHHSGDLTKIFSQTKVVPRNVYQEWVGMAPDELRERLKGFFNPFWEIKPLSPVQINVLRAIIHPEILIKSSKAKIVVDKAMELAPPSVQTLDLRQERNAKYIGDGHRIIFGVAGSGKTVMLVSRAKYLNAHAPEKKILMLCYNVSLKAYLRSVLIDCRNVDVHNFHGWATKNGCGFNFDEGKKEKETDENFGLRFREFLASGKGDSRKYDTVFVDEAQDFPPEWFECVLWAMKDPENGDLIIVGDGSQGIRRTGKIVWSKLGIKARGRTINTKFDLDKNYRNSREILELAAQFVSATDSDWENEMGGMAVDPDKAIRSSGCKPFLIKAKDKKGEMDTALEIIKKLTSGKQVDARFPFGLEPSDIGVLYARKTKYEQTAFATFMDDLDKAAIPFVWMNADKDSRGKINDNGVKIQTIHSSKGLQYRAVILLWADQLPGKFENTDIVDERRLLYVALTRPEDYLFVTHSGDSDFVTAMKSSGKMAEI